MVVVVLLAVAACQPQPPGDKDGAVDSADTAVDSGGDTSPRDETGDSAETGGPDETGETGETGETRVDADADGYSEAEGDCDDTRANVRPGAPDACDSLDQDCDGEPVPTGSCSEIVDAEVAASRIIVGDGEGAFRQHVTAGDADGDARLDSWIANGEEDLDGFSLLPGSAVDAPGDESDRIWYTVTDDYPTYQYSGAVGAGDHDGNGYDDLWLSAREYQPIGSVGGAFLFLGGPGRWTPGTRYAMDEADGYWEDPWGISHEHADVLAGGDLTGDGLDDAIFRATFNDDGVVRWGLFPGTTDPPPFGASAADLDVWIDTHGEESSVSYSNAWFAGDLDGDGSEELIISHRYTVGAGTGLMVIEGEDLAGADGAWAGDLARGYYYDDGSGDALGVGVTDMPADRSADVDGDGLPNLVGVHYTESAVGLDPAFCSLVFGSGIPSGNVAGTELARICTLDVPDDGSEPYAAAVAWINDVDGDGGADLMVGRDTGWWDYDYSTCVVRSSLITAGGVVDMLDASAVPGPCYEYPPADVPLWIDMTGDGLSDMVVSQDEYDSFEFGDRAGRLLIVDGFDIPWDDPTKW